MATLLIDQFLVYAGAWLIAAALLREARLPALLWSCYGGVQALGFDAMNRLQQPGQTLPLAAAMLFVLAYSFATMGIDAFMHRRLRYLPAWAAVVGAAEAFLTLGALRAWPPIVIGIGYDLAQFALLAAPLLAMRRSIIREFGAWGAASLVPAGLMAALLLVRVVQLLIDPSSLRQYPSALQRPDVLATVLVAAGAFNLGFVGLVLGRAMVQLRALVETDPLTGLLNRAGLDKRTPALWRLAQRFNEPLSLAFIDINEFKRINDSQGHEAGDRAIARVAAVLQGAARAVDVVGRWGGDEFVVWMPHTDAEGARQAAGRLRAALRAEAIPGPSGEPVTLSIGLATRAPEDPDAKALIDRADIAMYRDKGRLDGPTGG